jgi:hypothetical protein
MGNARLLSLRLRAPLVVLALLVTFMLSLMTGSAHAATGFCEFAKLGPGGTCESSSFTTINRVFGEVTAGNAEICVAIHESSGVLLGKKCGKNKAESQEGVGASSAKAWIHNNSGTATVTVFGSYI